MLARNKIQLYLEDWPIEAVADYGSSAHRQGRVFIYRDVSTGQGWSDNILCVECGLPFVYPTTAKFTVNPATKKLEKL